MGNFFEKADTALTRGNQAVICVLMMAMFAMVFANVVTRYGFGYSIAWAEEVSSYLMIWTTFLGGGLALRQGRHVAIDVLQDRLPKGLLPLARTILAIAILLFLACLFVFGIQFVAFGWAQETPVTQIPMGIPYLAVPLGALLFAAHLLFMFRSFIQRQWDYDDDEDMDEDNAPAGALADPTLAQTAENR